MDLRGLPQFTLEAIDSGGEHGSTRLVGRLSHLRGVRNDMAYLYRTSGPSIVGTVEHLTSEPGVPVVFTTWDAELGPELRVGESMPWLDGYWQPYHLSMILAPVSTWERRAVQPVAARYFRLEGVTGWQPTDSGALPEGAEDLGVRDGGWDHEHCELCRAHIGAGGAPEGYVNPDDLWLCEDCFNRYARQNDVSFATEV